MNNETRNLITEWNVQTQSQELVQYVRTSKLSVKGKLGIEVLKEASVTLSGKDTFELVSNIGQVDRNEVAIDDLCNALQVM